MDQKFILATYKKMLQNCKDPSSPPVSLGELQLDLTAVENNIQFSVCGSKNTQTTIDLGAMASHTNHTLHQSLHMLMPPNTKAIRWMLALWWASSS